MRRLFYVCVLSAFIAIGCEENSIRSTGSQVTEVEFNSSSLKALGDSAWYEAWLIWGEEDNFQSVGVFRVDEAGNPSPKKFDANLGYLQESKQFLLTIEQDDVPGYIITTTTTPDTTIIDSVEGPSSYRILGATIMANSGELSLGHEKVLNFNFLSASGSYTLATPSDTLNLNPTSGVWFVAEDTLGNKIKGLNLPSVPDGWNYQGWVSVNGVEIPTGSFRNPGRADQELQYYEPTGTGYSFPGEDLLINAPGGLTFPLDLTSQNTEIFITLEPKRPANCNNPFATITLFHTTLPVNAEPGVIYTLDADMSSLPAGMITLNVDLYE